MRVDLALIVLLGIMTPLKAAEPPKASDIIKIAVAGRDCGEDVHTGKYCSFTVDSLEFTILGVGESDTWVSFRHSDMHDRYFGTSYQGCVGIGTGMGFDPGSPPQQVYVSTKTANVYMSRKECQAAK